MFRKYALIIGFCAVLSFGLPVYAQNKTITATASDRERDGLLGPVRRITVESSKITIKNGLPVEQSRVLRAVTTYDPRGAKVDNAAYPIDSTSPAGTERYKYDDNGNIVEMELLGKDGAIVSREHYKYVLDEVGNWKQMTTSLAVFEDGKLSDEPVEVTYRTITYFYSQEIARLVSGSTTESRVTSAATSERSAPKTGEGITPKAETSGTSQPDNSNATEQPANKSSVPPVESAETASTVKQSQESTESSQRNTEPPANLPAKTDADNTAASQPSSESNVTLPTSVSADSTQPAAERPQTANGYYELGVRYLESGRNAEAADALNQAVFKDPEYGAAYVKLGLAYTSLRKYKEAVAVFKMAVRIKRELLDSEAYFQMGHAYSAIGKHSEALGAFKQALYISRAEAITVEGEKPSRIPTSEELHYSLGLAYHNLGRIEDAIKELQQVVSINPRFAEAYYGLAVCYVGIGDRKSAEKQQQILSGLNPDLAARIAQALATNRNIPPGLNDGILGARRR